VRAAHKHLEDFSRPLTAILRHLEVSRLGAGYMLGENLISGHPFTVEGFACNGHIGFLGVVDADYYRGTRSYRLFRYPSVLPTLVQARARGLVSKLMRHIEYRHGAFNIDCLFDKRSNRIWILEINPRMAAQIADLFEKVDGINSYEALITLAQGHAPILRKGRGRYKVAGSFVFRRFADARIVSINEPESVLSKFPDARVHVYYSSGDYLSEDTFQDMKSYVYAIVNVGADSERELEKARDRCEMLLAARFRAVKESSLHGRRHKATKTRH
jgi:biotin carboxylase